MVTIARRAKEVKKIVLCYRDSLPASWLSAVNKLRGKLERAGIEVGGSLLLIRRRQGKAGTQAAGLGLGVDIVTAPIHALPADADIILTHKDWAQQAQEAVPKAWVIPLTRFLAEPAYNDIVNSLLVRELPAKPSR